MEELNKKYIKTQLSFSELEQLKKDVDERSNSQIGNIIEGDWNSFQPSQNQDVITDSHLERLYDSIKHKLEVEDNMPLSENSFERKSERSGDIHSKNSTAFSSISFWYKNIAAVLFPLLVIGASYLSLQYFALQNQKDKIMTIATKEGEQASITLPDNSQIMLNAVSKLTYNPSDFNSRERKVSLDGEAYFKVSKDTQRPFQINTDGAVIKVLGTVFNLNAYKNESHAYLSLEDGTVLFSSQKSGENVILKPNQRVVLNKNTGRISVETVDKIESMHAWTQHELVFQNVPLSIILKQIKKHHSVQFIISNDVNQNAKFTGVLPVNDLQTTINILAITYDLKANIQDNIITLKANN